MEPLGNPQNAVILRPLCELGQVSVHLREMQSGEAFRALGFRV